jgi:hypothetical protein
MVILAALSNFSEAESESSKITKPFPLEINRFAEKLCHRLSSCLRCSHADMAIGVAQAFQDQLNVVKVAGVNI